MGDFTTVDKVKSLFRRLKVEADTGTESTNTVVTIEEVDEFILEAETIVKARLRTCYVIDPLSGIGPESLIIIGTVVKFKVAQVIKGILELTENVSSERKNQDVTASWGKKAKELLDGICPPIGKDGVKVKPTIPLPDTSQTSDPPTGDNLFNGSTNAPLFEKGKDNW